MELDTAVNEFYAKYKSSIKKIYEKKKIRIQVGETEIYLFV